MNEKEARRVYVIEEVANGNITIAHAAKCLGLSERQVKRLKKGVTQKGTAALIHGNRGRTPKHTIPKDIRDQIISLGQGLYRGTSSEHFSELLEENEGIRVSSKSITRILKGSGVLPPKAPRKRRRRKSRERMPREGLLVQGDGSKHAWFEGRGPEATLHGIIDDATSKVLGLYFREEEDLKGYLEVVRQVVRQYGVPHTLYSDGHSIFFSPKKDKLTVEEQLAGKQVALTQLGRALYELGITQIEAGSPEAKGRIERLWGTLQSRLVVELRVAGISAVAEANAFLPGFIKRFNKRFAVEAADPKPAYRPLPEGKSLDTVLCAKEPRTVSNGSTISYGGRTYRLIGRKGSILSLVRGAKVDVLLHTDDSIDALYQGQRYTLEAFQVPAPQTTPKAPIPRKSTAHKPAPDNPWLRFVITRPKPDPADEYFREHERLHRDSVTR